ncbi:hypothetical protein J4457_00915 [Candidatus Woesearchaeota archaeon]|nr:hypothetical protein [Candidatus Woesearchaeota archaeon]
MDAAKLAKLGLTEQQAKVYLKLLEVGPNSVGTLIKQVDISRISCYDTLNRLMSRGLVSFVKARGKRIYQSTDPCQLLHIAEEREQQARHQKECIKEILPELSRLRSLGEQEEKEANIYKTKEGIKSLFELMLKERKPIYAMSATGKALQEMKYYFPQWHKKRQDLKIPVRIIFNKEMKNTMVTEMPLSKVKFLPQQYSSPSTLFVFGSYVATLLWSDVPFAFLIKSKEVSKSYHNYFKLIWKIAK